MEFKKIEQLLNQQKGIDAARMSINAQLINHEVGRVCQLIYKACQICLEMNRFSIWHEDRFVIEVLIDSYAIVSLVVEFSKNQRCNPITGHILYTHSSPLSISSAQYINCSEIIEMSKYYRNDSGDMIIRAYSAINADVVDDLLFKKIQSKNSINRVTKITVQCNN